MSAEMAYTYKPFRIRSTIRLIKILRDKVDNKVVCILEHFDQAEAPPYCAVSYVWGNSTPTGSIYLGNDPSHIHLHPLHRNLLVFLGCMWEQQMFDTFLWTDSLCLNQNDDTEKSQQVPRMGEIYEHANEVLIWLGHEPEKEEKMRIVRDWPTEVDWRTLDMSDSDERESAMRNEEVRGPIDGEKWNHVKEAAEYLLLLPYWRRVWIVQEVALSRKALIACGSVSLNLDTFREKVNEFRKTRPEFNYQPTIWSLCELRDQKGKMPLWQLMCDFYLAESSLTIDKVYGFVGLVEESEKEPSIAKDVNYKKTVPEVFWDAIFECRAPWDQYSHVLFYMSHMVVEPKIGRLHKHITDLEDYMKSRLTSSRHVTFAEIVLRVFKAARIYARENAMSLQDWRQAIDRVFSVAKSPVGEHSELQNAAAIGLVLSSVIDEAEPSRRSGQSNRAISDSSWEWQEVQLKDKDLGSVAASGPASHPNTRIKLTTPVPKTSSQTYLAKIGKSIYFYIHGSSFQLVAVLDTEHGPGKSWTISLNTAIGTRSCEIGE